MLLLCTGIARSNAMAGEERHGQEVGQKAIQLSACSLPGLDRPARCGVLDVPENPARPDGRRLRIGVAVVPASGERALADPIVPLMGGPGEDAISAAAFYADQFAELLRARDLLLVDQRGTGRSNALRCTLHSASHPAASLRDLFPAAAVEDCLRRLRTRADLTQYSFAHFANDLEQVRRALDYGPMNLFAGSYGTRAAQVYLRAHPDSVRTAYLGSVVPIDMVIPATMAKAAQEQFEGVFAACSADTACATAFPGLREEFRQVLAQLDSQDIHATVAGQTKAVPLVRGRVVEWLRARLYRPLTAAEIPWLIHQAYQGEWNPIAEGILSQASDMDSALSLGLFFSITCAEDIAFIREEEATVAARDTFLGDYRLRQQQVACRHWPRAQLAEDYRKPVRSEVPTMFVSGDMDAASPLWFTERVASGFRNRVEVVARGQGHTEWNDCVARLYRELVREGATEGLYPGDCQPIPRPPFKTR